jgi:hypothetical protein
MQFRELGLAILVITMSMIFGATIASAGFGSRPDLADVDSTFYSDKDSSNWAWMSQDRSVNRASGGVSGTAGNGNTGAQVSWALYEPDKVKRSNSGGSMSQKRWVALGIYTYNVTYSGSYSYFSTGTTVEDCKASTSYKADKKTEGFPATGAKWSAKCKNLDDTGITLPVPVEARLRAIFDKKVIDLDKGKVKIKGNNKTGPGAP